MSRNKREGLYAGVMNGSHYSGKPQEGAAFFRFPSCWEAYEEFKIKHKRCASRRKSKRILGR